MSFQAQDYVTIIQEKKKDLAQDILHDIIEDLRDAKVLTKQDFVDIMGDTIIPPKHFEEAANKFLDILITKKPSDIEKFVKILEQDYYWLYKLFPAQNNAVEEPLILGGVPKLPKRHVLRKKMFETVKNELFNLNRGKFLVLHGMPGCGKSTLAAECLYDQNLINTFDGTLMWISIGYDADISSLQAEVNHFLHDPVNVLSGNIKHDLILIRKKLYDKNYLVILDDVPSKKVVDALNFGCKILITTRDQDIMEGYESVTKFIEVSSHFEEEETMDLFAKAIDVKPEDLPQDTRLIFKLTRGFPLSISLLGGYLEDNKERALLTNSDIWQFLRGTLENKDHGLRRFSMGKENQVGDVIGLSVKSLPTEIKLLFEDFALFVQDINIKSEVLCTLWSVEMSTVESHLLKLVKMSLLVRKWIGNSYVYGIHDLVLSYLKDQLTKDETKALHKKLITNYRKKCSEGDLSKLPRNDNYIWFYIGYHLKNAGLLSEFQNLYTNLEFIEAKLHIVGPAESLLDYNKYYAEITGGQESMFTYVREIQSFIERCWQSDYWNNKTSDSVKPDIVQFIFQETPVTSYLHKSALKLADKRSDMSYIRFPLGSSCKDKYPSSTLPHRKGVSCVCVTQHPNIVLIGYDNGLITMFNIIVNTTLYNYTGHKSAVNAICVNHDSSYFLSYSSGDSVSVWPLFTGKEILQENTSDVFDFSKDWSGLRTPSPSRIQEGHSPLWPTNNGIESSFCLTHPSKVVCAVYAGRSNPDLIASCTSNYITVWKKDQQMWSIKSDSQVNCCVFCVDDRFVITGGTCISVYSAETGEKSHHFEDKHFISSPILKLFSDPDDIKTVFLATSTYISSWVFGECEKPVVHYYPKTENDQKYYLVNVVKHIAAVNTNSDIEIFDKSNCAPLEVFHRPNSEVKCMALSKEWLLTAYQDNTLCIWPLKQLNGRLEPQPIPPASLKWLNNIPYSAAASSVPSVIVRKERELIWELPCESEVHLLDLSPDANFVAFSLKDNQLIRCKIDKNTNVTDSMPQSSPLAFIHTYCYKGSYLVLSAASEGQLLVWWDDKVKFLCEPHSKLHNAYLIGGKVICISHCRDIEVYELENPTPASTLLQGSNSMHVVNSQISIDNNLAIVYRDDKNFSETIAIYETSNCNVIFEKQLPSACVCMAFSPNGEYFAAYLENKTVIVQSVKDSQTEMQFPVYCDAETMAISNDKVLSFRTTLSLYVLPADRKVPPASACIRSSTAIVSASPDSSIFATLNSSCIVHTFYLFNKLYKS